MRVSLFLILAGALTLTACEKSDKTEERWVETIQRQEVIVFKKEAATPSLPNSSVSGTAGSFYFQSRNLPDYMSRANESGIYFYAIEGDSIILQTSQKKFYFKMAPDGNSFTIGLFYYQHEGLPKQLVFRKQ